MEIRMEDWLLMKGGRDAKIHLVVPYRQWEGNFPGQGTDAVTWIGNPFPNPKAVT